MKIQKIFLLAVCIFAHSFTQPASTFASKLAQNLTPKNIATLTGFAGIATGIRILVQPENPISNLAHKNLADFSRDLRNIRHEMKPGESSVQHSQKHGEIPFRKPTKKEAEYLLETVNSNPNIQNPEKFADVYIAYPAQSLFNGNYNDVADRVCIDQTLYKPENRSQLAFTTLHERTHYDYAVGHEILARPSTAITLYVIPSLLLLLKNNNRFTQTCAATGLATTYALSKLYNMMYWEEHRADTYASRQLNCAGCSEKIISQECKNFLEELIFTAKNKLPSEQNHREIENLTRFLPIANLDKYKATRREVLKGIVVASGGYAKYEIFTNPEKLAKMRQSCALCSPKSVEIT